MSFDWETNSSMIERFMDRLETIKSRSRAELRLVLALLIPFWLCFQIVFFIYDVLGDQPSGISLSVLLRELVWYIFKPVELAIVAAGMILCLGVFLALQQVRHFQLWKQLLMAAGAGLVSAAGFCISVSIFCRLFGIEWPSLTPRFFIADTLRWLPSFVLWAAMILAVTYNSEMRERERRLALAQAQAQDAKIEALRYQINPHLLYNTLNSIAALILDDRKDLAESMVVRLSDFFRATLSSHPQTDVSLVDEIALQRLYLDIEQMRFAAKLTSEFEVPAELEQVRVPSLLLQPLIENSIKHGMNRDGSPTHLRVSARRLGNQVLLEVADNGPGRSSSSGTGIGLQNVCQRLRSRFGEAATIEVESEVGKGFAVRLKFPYREGSSSERASASCDGLEHRSASASQLN